MSMSADTCIKRNHCGCCGAGWRGRESALGGQQRHCTSAQLPLLDTVLYLHSHQYDGNSYVPQWRSPHLARPVLSTAALPERGAALCRLPQGYPSPVYVGVSVA